MTILVHEADELKKLKVTRLSDPETLCRVETRISSQCMPLDHALGGGYPVRRVVELYGDNSTGKSMLAAGAIADTQRIGGVAAYADTEIAQDPTRMLILGVDEKSLLMCYPNTVDGVFEYLREFIAYKNRKFGLATPLTFVWDSVAAIATMAELEKSEKEGIEGKQYPDVARALSQAFRQVVHEVAENNVLFLLTNQTRQKLGVMFGDGATTTGGMAIRFYASIRVELESRGLIKDDKRVIGANVQATTVKNRLHPPYQRVMLPVYYKYGVDEAEATLQYLLDTKLIDHEKGAAWYTLNVCGEEVKFQKKGWNDIFIERAPAIESMLAANNLRLG